MKYPNNNNNFKRHQPKKNQSVRARARLPFREENVKMRFAQRFAAPRLYTKSLGVILHWSQPSFICPFLCQPFYWHFKYNMKITTDLCTVPQQSQSQAIYICAVCRLESNHQVLHKNRIALESNMALWFERLHSVHSLSSNLARSLEISDSAIQSPHSLLLSICVLALPNFYSLRVAFFSQLSNKMKSRASENHE